MTRETSLGTTHPDLGRSGAVLDLMQRGLAVGLRIPAREASFAVRGFRSENAEVRARLEAAGRAFLSGYNAALETRGVEELEIRLGEEPRALRGFAFEGASMALALLTGLGLSRGRSWRQFVSGPGDAHRYMMHVGAGWAIARLPWWRLRAATIAGRLDALFGWLAIDGYGFHEGYFHGERTLRAQRVPGSLRGYAARAFDQGLGRSLWFAEAARPADIHARIVSFEARRHDDLWSGVGLASAYAGGASEVDLGQLLEFAGHHRGALRQGVAFAAEARERSALVTADTELVCRVLCGGSSRDAALVARSTLSEARLLTTEPLYEAWRRRVQAVLSVPLGDAR